MPILSVRDLSVRFGGIIALDQVSFEIETRQIVGLIGPNGDFQIDGTLTPAPPNPCENPVLLIRGGAGDGNWFAAGIPKD